MWVARLLLDAGADDAHPPRPATRGAGHALVDEAIREVKWAVQALT